MECPYCETEFSKEKCPKCGFERTDIVEYEQMMSEPRDRMEKEE